MKLQIIFIWLLLLSINIQAQHQLSGNVISNNNSPIAFASVSVYPIQNKADIIGVVSKENGSFLFQDLKPNVYQLTVQMLGYEDWTQQIEISKNIELEPITLKGESTMLDVVQIVAHQSIVENHLGKKTLRIGKDLTMTGSNALEALEIIPSVRTTPRGQVEIRGNSNIIVYINGTETKRDPSTLKFISAESLEKIEVITNPSAKYDAEGVGGIINIVYKKDQSKAFKLELISNLSILTNPFYLSPNGGLNISWSKKKLSFYSNLSHDYGKYTNYVNSKRINLQDSLQRYKNLATGNGIGKISNALLGFAFEPETTTAINLEINYDRWDLEMDIQKLQIFEYRFADTQTINIPINREEVEDELWINLSIEKKLRNKQMLRFSLTAGGENENNFTNSDYIDLTELPTNAQQFLLNSDEIESQRYYHGKLDYEFPFFDLGTIEAGMKADFVQYHIFQKINLRSDTIELADNDFNMNMKKFGVFVVQKNQIKKLEYAIGLRLEQFASKAFQQAGQSTFNQNYIRLFPSVQFNYLLVGQEQTMGLNYSRRINRPGFFDLNPYVSYEDPLNLETGNPALEPEIADLIELNYNKEWKTFSLDLTLYNRKTINSIQYIVEPIDYNRSLTRTANIGNETRNGLEAQLEYRANKIFKTSGTFVVAQNKYETIKNEISYNKQSTWNMQIKQEIKLNYNWKIDLSGVYRAPSYQIQEKRHKAYYFNFGVGKKFKNKQGAMSLSVRDLFNTREYIVSLLNAGFEVERSYKWQTRQITIGLKYNLKDKNNNL